MNKTELVAAIAEKADLQKKDAEKAIAAFTEVVAETLKKGDKIQLVVLVLSKLLREQQEPEEIRRQKRRLRSRLPKLRNSKQEKL